MLRTAADLGLPPIAELHIKPLVKGISGKSTPLGDPRVLKIVHPVAGTQRLVAYKAPHALPESAHVLLGTGAISVTGISLDYHVEHGPGHRPAHWLAASELSMPRASRKFRPTMRSTSPAEGRDSTARCWTQPETRSRSLALDSQTHTRVRREDVLGCGPRIDCLAATPHTANATAASRSFESSLLEIFSGEGHLSPFGRGCTRGGGSSPRHRQGARRRPHVPGDSRSRAQAPRERQAGRAVGRVSMPDLLGLAADAQAPARAQDHQAS